MEAVAGADPGDPDPAALMQETERKLAVAEGLADRQKALQMTKEALHVHRRICHPLSLMRYHAECAACELAMRIGETSTARECSVHIVYFLEVALAHVLWHPTLVEERLRFAELHATQGAEGRQRAVEQLEKSVAALQITHGTEDPVTRRVIAKLSKLRMTYVEVD